MNTNVKHLFVLNPKSFWHKWKQDAVLSHIHDFFETEDAENCTVYFSRFPRDAAGFISRFAREFSAETTLRVYAIGGDGILFDCLNGIMGLPNAELAALPYGHTNNFVWGFGKENIPLFRNIFLQCTSPAIPMDVIRFGSSYVLNFCTIGLESLAILNAGQLRKDMQKGDKSAQWMCRRLYNAIYYAGFIPACFNKKVLGQYYEIDIDGEDLSGRYRSILIANASYYGGNKHPAASAMPNDGMMDIILARSGSSMRAISMIPFYILGGHDKISGDFIMKRGRKIYVSSRDPALVNYDGTAFYDGNFTAELMPAALQFVDASGQGYKGALADG